LSQDDFQRLYRQHPEIADAVVTNLGKRLRALVKVVEKISLRSVPGRVAKALLEKVERECSMVDGVSFRLNRTQSDLAHELATSRESVARALGDLRRGGIISTEGRQVTILSMRGLLDVAQGEEKPHPIHSKPNHTID
jgi:CRP/FNR family cyclic AMP-dependent transcriptional regulator